MISLLNNTAEFRKTSIIDVEIKLDNYQCNNAWIGIIPYSVPHGNEKINDQNCRFFYYIDGKKDLYEWSIVATEPGIWDLRLHASNKEISSLTIKIYNERFQVPFTNPKTLSEDWMCCQKCKKIRSDDETTVIICDHCQRGYHLDCLKFPLDNVPSGDWFCDECNEMDISENNEDIISSLEKTALCIKDTYKDDIKNKDENKDAANLVFVSLLKKKDPQRKYHVLALDSASGKTSKLVTEAGYKIIIPNHTETFAKLKTLGYNSIPITIQKYCERIYSHIYPLYKFSGVYLDFNGGMDQLKESINIINYLADKSVFGFTIFMRNKEGYKNVRKTCKSLVWTKASEAGYKQIRKVYTNHYGEKGQIYTVFYTFSNK